MTGNGIRIRIVSSCVLFACLIFSSGCGGFNLVSFEGKNSWEDTIASGDRAYQAGNYVQASEYYEEALRLAEGNPLRRDRLSSALNKLGFAALGLEEYDEAEAHFSQALATDRNLYNEPHTAIGADLNNLGLLHYRMRQYEKAADFYRKALVQYGSGSNEDRLGKSTTMINLALVYCDDNRYDEAVPLLAKALDLRRQVLGEGHPDVALAQSNLGMACIGTEEYDEARRHLEKSLAALSEKLPANHPDVTDTALKLASLYAFLNREEDARRISRRYGV